MSKRKKWRCFFCNEVFTDPGAAGDHFGSDKYEGFDHPGCIDPLRTDEKARLKELHDAVEHAMQMQREAEENDEAAGLLESFTSELERLFYSCGGLPARSPHQAWLKLEAVQNESKDARARVALLENALERIVGCSAEEAAIKVSADALGSEYFDRQWLESELMGLYNFKERFAPIILDGSKTHTIRPKRANRERPGNICHLYTGLRTRNACLLFRAPCTSVDDISICKDGIILQGVELDEGEANAFAYRDGFRTFGVDRAFDLMMRFWMEIHRLPFAGDVIHWDYARRQFTLNKAQTARVARRLAAGS
jgi:hypothetical protein